MSVSVQAFAVSTRTSQTLSGSQDESVNVEHEADICSICRDPLELDETAKKIVCAHVFHQACIDQWLMNANTCPLCRIVVDQFAPRFRVPEMTVEELLAIPDHTPYNGGVHARAIDVEIRRMRLIIDIENRELLREILLDSNPGLEEAERPIFALNDLNVVVEESVSLRNRIRRYIRNSRIHNLAGRIRNCFRRH